MNKRGHPETLVASQLGNANALKHGAHSPRLIQARAAEIATELTGRSTGRSDSSKGLKRCHLQKSAQIKSGKGAPPVLGPHWGKRLRAAPACPVTGSSGDRGLPYHLLASTESARCVVNAGDGWFGSHRRRAERNQIPLKEAAIMCADPLPTPTPGIPGPDPVPDPDPVPPTEPDPIPSPVI